MTDLGQQMGRAGRAPLAADAEVGNELLVVVSVSMWSLLVARAYGEDVVAAARADQRAKMTEVRRCVLVPTRCLHVALEEMFGPAAPEVAATATEGAAGGRKSGRNRRPAAVLRAEQAPAEAEAARVAAEEATAAACHKCVFCTDSYPRHRVNRSALKSVLQRDCWRTGKNSPSDVEEELYRNRGSLWPNAVSEIRHVDSQFLLLQLIAAGILKYEVQMVTVKKVKVAQITMDFARTAGGTRFVLSDDASWAGINFD
jgi:nucleoid-associated protein YgaU